MLTGSDDHLVKVWSTETGYLQHTLRGHDSDITEIVNHPTRPIIVSASSDTTLRVWDVETGAALHVLDGGHKEVNAVQFSPCPDRPYLVSGGADGSVRLWNADNFSAGCTRVPIPERSPTSRYRHVSDTRRAASNTAAGATSRIAPPSPVADGLPGIALSDPVQMNMLPASALTMPTSSTAAASIPAASTSRAQPGPSTSRTQFAASTSPGQAAASPVSRQAPERTLSRDPTGSSIAANSMVSGAHPTYSVLSVGFNAGATRLAVGGTDGCAYLYAVEKADDPDSPFPKIRHLTTLRGHSDHIIQVLFSRSGDSIVTACRDGTARIWNRIKARLPVGKKGKETVAGMGKWNSMVLDCRSQIQADARSVLSGGASGSACGSIVPRMRRTIFPVSVDAAMWSLNDKYLFTASSDAKIRMWEAETGSFVRVLEAHEREVYVMDCHPTDPRILLSAGYDGKCVLWDVETGKQLRTFSIADESQDPLDQSIPFGSHKRPSVTDGQFSSDGLSFALSDTSGAITIFGVESVEATALAPEEQFFSKDYAPFRRDAENRAIDEDTGLLLHLVNKGRLCDKDLRPHPPELQPNVLSPRLIKTRVNAEGNNQDAIKRPSHSPNAVENKNRDALLLRAKEFRENQEKEERRLLREAREARRRMIIDKEKAALERDVVPTFQLRDFEVPDSDYDDSDEDFDGDLEEEPSESSSSSSSDEEDMIQPVRSRRSSQRKIPSSSEGEDEIRLQESRGTRRVDKTESMRKIRRGGIAKQRRRSLRMKRIPSDLSGDLGESEDDAGDESPGYEIGSQDGESENSGTSSERMDAGGNEQLGVRRMRRNRTPKKSNQPNADVEPRVDGEHKPAPVMSSSLPGPSSSSQALKLVGASRWDGSRRMKIKIHGPASTRSPPLPHYSSSALENPATRPPAESRREINNITLTQGTHRNGVTNSVGSWDGRGQASEAGIFMRAPPPRNPSFTSERVDRKESGSVIERSSEAVEENQGDTASFVRPRRRRNQVEDGPGPAPQGSLEHRQSSAEKSRVDSDMPSDFANAINDSSNVLKGDANEKSLLSDSPARALRTRARHSTRKRKLEIVLPMYDIDEVAERELALLDAEGGRKSQRKRRKHSQLDLSDDDYASDEHDTQRGADRDEAGNRHRKLRKRSGRRSELIQRDDVYPERPEGKATRALSTSAWLRSSSNRYTYVPQLGDDVMYFPEGHASAISISRAAGLDPLAGLGALRRTGKEPLDGTTFASGATPIRFQIIDVSYEFPVLPQSQRPRSLNSRAKASRNSKVRDPRTAKTTLVLTLRHISGLRRRAVQTDPFVLIYYPVDAPEYLVLTSRVEAALSRSWKASDRFRILFLNERRAWQYYTGRIRNVKPSMTSVMWNTVEVVYDNESEKEKATCEFVSPWELEAFDIVHGAKTVPIQYFHSFRSSTVEPGLFPIIAREFETIREMESTWRVHLSWLDSVEALASMPGYCSKVPCPMDFDTVLVRLCTGYYRHFCSLIHDINLLKANAVRFHGANSDVGKLSMSIFSRLTETAERTRATYIGAMMPLPQSAGYPQGNAHHTGNGGSRAIRPRPTYTDTLPQGYGQHPSTRAARPFPVSLSPTQSGVGFAMPSPHAHESSGILGQSLPASALTRQWPGMRTSLNHPQGHMQYTGQSLGMALPPILPGMTQMGSAARGARASRIAARGQPGVRQHSGSQTRRGHVGPSSAGNFASPPQLGIAPTPHSASMFGQSLGAPYIPQHVGHPGQITMVANSNPTMDGSRVGARRIAPNSALSDPRGMMRSAFSSQLPANGRIAETGNLSSRGRGASGTASPTQEGAGPNGGSLSMTQPPSQAAMLRQHNRGFVSAQFGDGGTHSWGRSMEGAGGTLPLQASTSESHLPQDKTGRSPSPTSPSIAPGDGDNRRGRQQTVSVRQQTVTAVTATAGYQEHSTISVAAAESTMSCGGADVAMQAATAESAEMVATERSQEAGGR